MGIKATSSESFHNHFPPLYHTFQKHVAKEAMKLSSFITPVCLLGVAASVEMTQYSTGPGVEVGFESFVKEYDFPSFSRNWQERPEH